MYLSVWSNAVWTPHRDPREPDVLDLPSREEVLERPEWPDIISAYVGSPLNAEETRDTIVTGDSDLEKERKKREKDSKRPNVPPLFWG